MIIPSNTPLTLPTNTAADEFSIEEGLERELALLRRGLDPDEESRIIRAFQDIRTGIARVSPSGKGPLGTRIARSRFDAAEAVLEAWAADAFLGYADGASPAAVLEAAGPDEPDRFTEAVRSAAENSGGEYPLEISVNDPRILFGRAYNRLIRPETPLEWVRLLPAGTPDPDQEEQEHLLELFRSSGDAAAPRAAAELLRLARESARKDGRPGLTESSRVPRQAAVIGAVGLRQVVGRSVTGGTAQGIAHFPGGSSPAEGNVLICDRYAASEKKELAGACALVEQRGTGFGPGAVAALELGIPHLYRAAEALTVPEGEYVTVNGATRLLVRIGQE